MHSHHLGYEVDVGKVEMEVAQAMQLPPALLWNVLHQPSSKVLVKAGQPKVNDLEAGVCSSLRIPAAISS